MISSRLQMLEDRLTAAAGRPEEIDALNALSSALISTNIERSSQLAQRALQIGQTGKASDPSYAGRAAASLALLGNINNLRCDYRAALALFLESQSLLGDLPDPDTRIRMLGGLGWVYFNLGDFPQAIEFMQSALKIARDKGDPESEAEILNSLGAVFGESGEKEASVEAHQRALKNLRNTDNFRILCIAHNNLAMTLQEMGAYDSAMQHAAECLKIARQLDSSELLSTALDTTGQIYLAQKEYIQAERCFRQALASYAGEGNDPDEMTLNLARAARGQGRLEEAAGLLQQALVSVENRQKNRFAYQFHELLSAIYEEQGRLPESIRHYKEFHALKSRFFNEDTKRRLSNLLVIQQTETTQIDAEIYHLKNLALSQEVSEHQQAVAQMEILATTDALTGMLNRRHFMNLAGYSFETARKSGSSLAAMMMDLDDFKRVNDHFGHLVGDQVLAEISAAIQAHLRGGDLLGRYGGEEFAAIFPGADLSSIQKLAERILKTVADHLTRSNGQAVQITISIGAALITPDDGSLADLLERADRALYAAKQAGKNAIRIDPVSSPEAQPDPALADRNV